MTIRTYTIHPPQGSPTQLRCDVIDDGSITSSLFENDIEIIGQLSNSSNGALLGQMNIGENIVTVVIKPAMYENPLVDFEWGTLAKREVAAYELSTLLGWGIVPPTVLRDVNNMQCSVQLFIPHDPREHYFTIAPRRHADMEKFIVFDYISNNADRKAGHLLLEEKSSFDLFLDPESETSGFKEAPAVATGSRSEASAFAGEDDSDGARGESQLWGIDHGLTFHVEDKLRTVMWEYAEQEITRSLLEDVNHAILKIQDVLSLFISPYEIEATLLRIEKLFANPYHRALDPSQRALPWPLV